MTEVTEGDEVIHAPTGRKGILYQKLPLGAYVHFPDGNEDFFPYEELMPSDGTQG
jgi:hypothetical protein